MGEGLLLLKDFALGVPLKYTEKEIMAMVPAVWLACWASAELCTPVQPRLLINPKKQRPRQARLLGEQAR